MSNILGGFGLSNASVTCGLTTINPVTQASYACPCVFTVGPYDVVWSQQQASGAPTGITATAVCPGCSQNKTVITYTTTTLTTAHNAGKIAPNAYTMAPGSNGTTLLVATLQGQLWTPWTFVPPV